MKTKELIWRKKAYIGQQILFSNNVYRPYQLLFVGAETLHNTNEHRINFALCYIPPINSTSIIQPNTGFSVAINLLVVPQEHIRFESFLGITEDINVEYRSEEMRSFKRFFPVKYVKFHHIEKDFIEYEIHCS